MKIIISMVFLLISGFNAMSQVSLGNDEEKEVHRIISQLFDGMRAGDSNMVHEVFTPDANLFTAFTNKAGEAVLLKGSLQKFLEAIGTPHDQVWDEPIWNVDIKVDGHLAQVWADYAFYYGGKFTHCGVDAFQLFKTKAGWRIFQLTDTRKTTGCEIPQDIEDKSLKK